MSEGLLSGGLCLGGYVRGDYVRNALKSSGRMSNPFDHNTLSETFGQ